MFGVFRIQHLPEVMSEIEDYLVKVTRWGRASCPSFRDRQGAFRAGLSHRLCLESVCVRTSE